MFAQAKMHVPIETARQARDHARSVGADCAVAIGGGSTVGLGKAIARESSLPIIAIPTTYTGSEMTPIYDITEDGLKRTGRDSRILPKTVVYDPFLSQHLPLRLSFVSGLNAIAHAAEGMYARSNADPSGPYFRMRGVRARRICDQKVSVTCRTEIEGLSWGIERRFIAPWSP